MDPSIAKADQIDQAWTQLAPAVEFGGVARETVYETALQDARDADAAVEQAKADLADKRALRDAKIAVVATNMRLVTNGVVGNPAYGDDSALYGAMGFVRRSQRASGLTQRGPTPPPPAP